MARNQGIHDRSPPAYDSYHGRRPEPYTLGYRPSRISSHSSRMEQKNGIPPPEQKKESKSFKKLLLNFMGYTSAHGIGRLANSKNLFWKLFWSLVCMGAFAMFIYQFSGLFKQFLSKPVTTSVSITFEKRLPFPAVTICNLNMLRRDVMPPELKQALKTKLDYSWSQTEDTGEDRRRRNIEDSGDVNYTWSSTTTVPTTISEYRTVKKKSGDDSIYDNDEYAEYRDDVNEHVPDQYDEEDDDEFPDKEDLAPDVRIRYEIDRLIGEIEDENDLHESGHLFEILIGSCTWKGVDCKKGNLSRYWSQHWNYKYGNCYSFNPGINYQGETIGVLKTTKPGPSQGLQLEIDVQQDQYIGPLSPEAGVRVLLHEQGAMPFPFEEGFSVSTGKATSIGIKKTQIVRLDRFNNKSCLPANELPKTNIYRRYSNITTYSQQACLNSCLGLSQRIRCGCSETAFPSDKAPCDLFDPGTSKCLKTVKYLFNNDKLSCLSDCSQPCEEEVIQKTISSSEWPSKAYKDYLISQRKYHNQSDNMLQLNVFFNELNYEKIEEKFSYGTINLLADVGGQLGLWIGISVITVCELIELIVMFFTVCVKKINATSAVHEVPAYG